MLFELDRFGLGRGWVKDPNVTDGSRLDQTFLLAIRATKISWVTVASQVNLRTSCWVEGAH